MTDRPGGGYDLTVLLLLTVHALIDEVHTRLAAAGFDDIRPAHGFAFQRLAPDGATGNDVAAHLGITKQAASTMLDYLEQHGYVERRADPRDGRGKLVVLTARGWACVEAAEVVFADVERRWAQDTGVDQIDALRMILRRIVAAAGADSLPLRLRPVW